MKQFLKNLLGKLEHFKEKYNETGCTSINLDFENKSCVGLLTVLRRMLTSKDVKPVIPFLHRFDKLYLLGAFSPITGCSHLLEMSHCNAATFQQFLDYIAAQNTE